ncbi:MAG: FAD-dependent oxidoreductase [Promethearchaeota archaeon]
MANKILIIGCGTAGAAATLMARKTSRDASITVLQDEAYPEYSRCGLPYAVSQKISKFDNLIIHSPNFYSSKLVGADLRLRTRATEVDAKNRTVQVEIDGGKTDSLSYDQLVLATGARPSTPPIKGLDANHVFHLHTLDDARNLQGAAKKGRKVAVIGAGLVGLETAEALHSMGLKITIIEFLDSVLPAMLDSDMGELLIKKMEAEGITVKLGTAAKEVTKTHVHAANRATEKEEDVPADLVIVATGVRANVKLATEAGLKIGKGGGILVDDKMRTSDAQIFAAGDCTEHLDLVTGQTIVSGLGSIALRQGEVAGINAAGGNAKLEGVVLARTTHLFGMEIAGIGPTKFAAEKANLSILASKFEGGVTAEYYPSNRHVSIKLLADKESGVLIGGQVIGPCAHQRVNVLSAALASKMTIRQVADLETCYAPPVAPIREPVTMAAQILALRYARLKEKS